MTALPERITGLAKGMENGVKRPGKIRIMYAICKRVGGDRGRKRSAR
jgi:hypothetical protein